MLAAAAAAGVAPRLARGAAPSATDSKLRFGFIGVGGRGTYLLRLILQIPEIQVTAVCDINESNLKRAIKAVSETGGPAPAGFSKGPTDYRRLLDRNDVDAVLIATPVPLHAPMAVDAMKAGKHVFSEVAAATTMEDCWALVDTMEKTGRTYMMAENSAYMRPNMLILNMAQKGVFGEFTYAECGYVHDCRNIKFDPDGTLAWRGEMARDLIGNLYPTHSLGPVAQWLGINRTDRLVSLVAMTTRQMALERYAARRFGKDHPNAKIKFAVGDSTTTVIQTANGVVIDLRYDTLSARPHPTTCYYALQGATASYDSDGERIWIEGRSKENTWEPVSKYAEEFDHPMWKKYESEAKNTEHGGGDFFPIREFVQAIRTGGPAPVDVYDAVTWSSITPLSAESLRNGNKCVEIPDFSRGKWKTRKA
jgi:predicted dehydrogenase